MKNNRLTRIVFLVSILLLCVLGLSVRRWSTAAPNFFNKYFPDAAWTMAVYCGFGLLFCKGVKVNFPAALLVSYVVECTQLLHTPLLEMIRGTRLGGFVLGYGFLWSDLVCYTVGALLCAAVEYTAKNIRRRKK